MTRNSRSTGPRRFARRLRRRAVRAARARMSPIRLGTARRAPWLRRGVLVAALLGVAIMPYTSQGGVGPASATALPCQQGHHGHKDCHAPQTMLRWTQPLPGSWNVLSGLVGTVPSSGLAYVAAGYGVVALGEGMTVYAYSAGTGHKLWQQDLTGFPAGAQIVSVRTWPGEVTAGVRYQDQRTEVVIATTTGTPTGQYPAALTGGAVAGTARYTVIVGTATVTSYDNATGRVRWRRSAGQSTQGWQSDGTYLYLVESTSGALGSAPVTALRRIDLATGDPHDLLPAVPAGPVPAGGSSPLEGLAAFDGRLATAFDGVVVFTSARGVTAYSSSTGVRLWSMAGAVPEGGDPQLGGFYLARGSSLVAVSPLTGRIRATAPSGGLYVVRDGIALGLDPDANGDAWGYYLAGQRVAMTATGLGWPHYFADLSGIGGSADPVGNLVVIAACAQAGPAAQPTVSPSATVTAPSTSASASTGSASASPSPAAAPTQACVRPELVALVL
jgi:outer membrane protein assembly factor BamB